MAINPLIALQGQVPSVAQGIEIFNQERERQRLQGATNAINELRATQTQGQRIGNLDARNTARLKSIVTGAARLAPALARGDTDAAMQILQQRRQALAEQGVDTTDTDEAIAMLEQGNVQGLTRSVGDAIRVGQAMGLLQTPELDKLQLFRTQQGGVVGVGQETGRVVRPDLGGALLAPETSQVTVNTGSTVQPGSAEATKVFGKKTGEAAVARNAQAQEAVRQNVRLDRMLLALSRGAETGIGEETLLDLKQLGNTLFDIGLTAEDSEQEVIRKISNEMALRLRNPESGLGLTGNTSNRDLQFLKASVAGLQRSRQGNIKIIDMMKRLNQMKVDVARRQAEIIQANEGFVPANLDAQLMEFVNNYDLFNNAERREIEQLINRQPDSQDNNSVPSIRELTEEQFLQLSPDMQERVLNQGL